MQESTLVELEKLFLALSDKTRLRLLALMADGEVSVGYLADTLGESQPKISRHLAYLRTSGLVSTRRDGKWIYYGIETQEDAAVNRVLDAALRSILSDGSTQPVRAEILESDDPFRSYDVYNEPVAEEYDDWAPAEMEIYLL